MKILLLILTLLLNTTAFASDLCTSSPEKILKLLSMNYQEFDQTPDQGFRELHAKGCYLSTAILIDAWHLNHLSDLSPMETSPLYFHAGQNYAFQGSIFYPIALKRFQSALLVDKASIKKYRFWNPFVQGTIAFFKKDKENLLENIKILKKLPKDNKGYPKTEVFIGALESLLKKFNQPYFDESMPKPAD